MCDFENIFSLYKMFLQLDAILVLHLFIKLRDTEESGNRIAMHLFKYIVVPVLNFNTMVTT